MKTAREVITEEILRAERNGFAVKLFFVLGGYAGISVWLNAVRKTSALWFVWVLIIAQLFLFLTIFVLCSLRMKQCGSRHSWLLLIPLCLSRVENWEVVILPVVAIAMLTFSTLNRNVAAEHLPMVPSDTASESDEII